jgi:hypothetical protein
MVGLRDQKLVDVYAELAGIDWIERMLGIDEGADAALLLCLGHAMQRQRGLAGRFRPENLDHPPPRQTADTERNIQPERTGRDRFDLDPVALAELHDRAFAKLALDLGERGGQRLRLIHGRTFNDTQGGLRHERALLMTDESGGVYARLSPASPLGWFRTVRAVSTEQDSTYTICSQFAICSFWRKVLVCLIPGGRFEISVGLVWSRLVTSAL